MAKIHPAIAGHVMEENDKLRELLRDCRMIVREVGYPKLAASIDAALSQQAEPTDTYTAVDMATAAAQGFRDGQAAVEQDTAQDEQEAPVVVATAILGGIYQGGSGPELGEIDIEVCTPALEELQCETVNSYDDVFLPLMPVAQHERIVAALTRPAQTEQQKDGWISVEDRLPEAREGTRYLVARDCGNGTLKGISVGFLLGGEWHISDDVRSFRDMGYRVTHWQLLPAAPDD